MEINKNKLWLTCDCDDVNVYYIKIFDKIKVFNKL